MNADSKTRAVAALSEFRNTVDDLHRAGAIGTAARTLLLQAGKQLSVAAWEHGADDMHQAAAEVVASGGIADAIRRDIQDGVQRLGDRLPGGPLHLRGFGPFEVVAAPGMPPGEAVMRCGPHSVRVVGIDTGEG